MDFSYLISISEGDKEFTNRFISTFEKNTHSLLSQMKKALEDENYEQLRKFAHQLKPSLEMLKLASYHTSLNIQENPQVASIEDIEKIEKECQMAVKEMNQRFI